jgi:hypothetical protein
MMGFDNLGIALGAGVDEWHRQQAEQRANAELADRQAQLALQQQAADRANEQWGFQRTQLQRAQTAQTAQDAGMQGLRAKLAGVTPGTFANDMAQRQAANTSPAWMPDPASLQTGQLIARTLGGDYSWVPQQVAAYNSQQPPYDDGHTMQLIDHPQMGPMVQVLGPDQQHVTTMPLNQQTAISAILRQHELNQAATSPEAYAAYQERQLKQQQADAAMLTGQGHLISGLAHAQQVERMANQPIAIHGGGGAVVLDNTGTRVLGTYSFPRAPNTPMEQRAALAYDRQVAADKAAADMDAAQQGMLAARAAVDGGNRDAVAGLRPYEQMYAAARQRAIVNGAHFPDKGTDSAGDAKLGEAFNADFSMLQGTPEQTNAFIKKWQPALGQLPRAQQQILVSLAGPPAKMGAGPEGTAGPGAVASSGGSGLSWSAAPALTYGRMLVPGVGTASDLGGLANSIADNPEAFEGDSPSPVVNGVTNWVKGLRGLPTRKDDKLEMKRYASKGQR